MSRYQHTYVGVCDRLAFMSCGLFILPLNSGSASFGGTLPIIIYSRALPFIPRVLVCVGIENGCDDCIVGACYLGCCCSVL